MEIQLEFLKMLVISAAVGGLVGIERELKERVIAGMRTFMLVSMFGTLSVYIAEGLNARYFVLVALFGIIFMGLLLGIVKNMSLWDIGITTPIVFIITFLLGVIIGLGLYLEGISSGIIITAILVSKRYSENFKETLTHKEIQNALEFGLIAFVLYPVVPDKTIDAFNLINPKTLILVVIVVATIGFAGFLALRRFGVEKGLPVVGILGGLINSEATTSAISMKIKKNKNLVPAAVSGIIMSNVTMFLRNLVIAGVVSLAVLKLMFVPMILMAVSGISYFYLFGIKKKTKKAEVPIESPFAIWPSIKFALLFTAISLIVNYIKIYGATGIYIASILGSVISSAAVVASLASLAALGSISPQTAAYAGVIAAVGSTLNKILIGRISGTKEFSKRLSKPMIIMASVGVVVLVLQANIWANI